MKSNNLNAIVRPDQEAAINYLLDNATNKLRQKLYEAYSRPQTYAARTITVIADVEVKDSNN